MSKINMYFGMDGTLVKRDGRDDCAPGDVRGMHRRMAFAPDTRMTDLIETASLHPDEFEVRIITIVNHRGGMCLDECRDKLEWLHDNIETMTFDINENFIPVIGSKSSIAKYLKNDGLDLGDVLISDAYPHLKDWDAAGGLAVTYPTGDDSSSSVGPVITAEMSSGDILEMLRIFSRVNHGMGNR